jgi:hypothetical protein
VGAAKYTSRSIAVLSTRVPNADAAVVCTYHVVVYVVIYVVVYMGCLYRAFRGVLEVYMVYIHVYRVYIGVIMVMQVYTRVNKEYII